MPKDKRSKKEKAAAKSDLGRLAKAKATKIPKVAKVTVDDVVEAPRPPMDWKSFNIGMGIVALLALVTYLPSLWHGLAFQDSVTFGFINSVTDPEQWQLTMWKDALLRPLSQPWVKSSFAADFKHYSNQYAWYHLVNVVLHVLTVVYLYCLVFRLGWRGRIDRIMSADPLKVAFMAAGIFACHPLATQSVVYLSSRSALLGTVNFLLCLNAFLIGFFGKGFAPRFWGYSIALFAGVSALISSPVGLSLPLVLIALVMLLKPPEKTWIDWFTKRPYASAALVISLVVLPYALGTGLEPAAASNRLGLPNLEPAAYYATQAKALVTYYLRCFFVPIGLSIDPPFAIADSWLDPFAIAGGALLIAASWAAFATRRLPLISLALVIFIAGYLSHALLVQSDAVTDAAFYLPLVGLSILASWFVDREFRLPDREGLFVNAALLFMLASLSVWRSFDWSSDLALHQATLRTNPASAITHTRLAIEYMKKPDLKKAKEEAEAALSIDPELTVAHFAKGTIANLEKDWDKSTRSFQEGLRLGVKQKLAPQVIAVGNLGLAEAYAHTGKANQIPMLVSTAMPYTADRPRLIYLMALSAFHNKDYKTAYSYLAKLVQNSVLLPDTLYMMSMSAYELGSYNESYQIARMANLTEPGPRSQLMLAKNALVARNPKDATEALQKLIKSEPDNTEALAMMALAQEQAGDKALADSYRKDAIKRDTNIFSKVKIPEPKKPEPKSPTK